jgi:DNA-binding transcriptional ArsR family regulator
MPSSLQIALAADSLSMVLGGLSIWSTPVRLLPRPVAVAGVLTRGRARMKSNEKTHCSGPRPSQGDSSDSPSEALHALVGSQRAKLLVALGRPRSIGELDEVLLTASGGATYHVRRLEAAGVVMRHRRGQRVLVELTGRGRSLLALFGA